MSSTSTEHFAIPIVAGIGNALMTQPMVRQLRDGVPQAVVRVVAMTSAMAEPFAQLRGVQTIVSGPGALRLLAALRSAGPIDTLIVPFPSNRWQYNVLAMRSGASRVLMHEYPAGHRACFSGVGQRVAAIRGLHDVDQNLRLLEPLGLVPTFGDAPRFRASGDQEAAGIDLLRQAGIDERQRFFAMHAGSARTVLAKAKRWPVTRYAELIRAMLRDFGWPVVLLEGPDERGVTEQIVRATAEVGSVPGKIATIVLSGPLGVAGAILSRARLYVGTDSGLAHLAAAVGRRAVTLFAPADPDRVAPFGNRDLVVQPSKPCSPCFLYPWEATRPKMRCKPPFCIEQISTEMVLQKIRSALGTG
ncbi:MAG: glycosyltransferase family 9 protein [Phycisphaerae bacterium]|nr:glycosyltransferase family 9 protein [Phycisphaerae bacterium]MDW8261516.1 glycosyltransferase family 9 protein [Phycisphaerales bacterium]